MARIAEHTIQEVLDRVDLVDLIGGHVRLTRSGNRFKGLCPFHKEKTPSFVVSPDRGIWHCFGCNAGGNAVRFIQLVERLEFPEAVRFLAEKSGVVLHFEGGGEENYRREGDPYRAPEFAADYFVNCLLRTPPEHPARQFLNERRINKEAALRFRIGYAPDSWDALIREAARAGIQVEDLEAAGLVLPRQSGEGYYDRFRHRVVFPILNTSGRVIAFGARRLAEDGPKYINSPETSVFSKSRTLYALNIARDAIRESGRALLCEGYMDALALHLGGFANTVATLGTALTEEHLRILSRYAREVFLVFDSDAAGQEAATRSVEALLTSGVAGKIVSLSGGKDPDEILRAEGPEAFQRFLNEAEDCLTYRIRRAREAHGGRTAHEKKQIAEEILPLISLVRSEVQRSEYLDELAGSLGVPAEVLARESRKFRKNRDYSKKDEDAGPSGPVGGAERRPAPEAAPEFEDGESRLLRLALGDLLRLCLTEDESVRSEAMEAAKQVLPLDEDPRYSSLFARLLATEAAGLNASAFLARCASEAEQSLVTAALSGEPVPPNFRNAIRQNLETIQNVRIKRLNEEALQRFLTGKNNSEEVASFLEEGMDLDRRRRETSFHANEPINLQP